MVEHPAFAQTGFPGDRLDGETGDPIALYQRIGGFDDFPYLRCVIHNVYNTVQTDFFKTGRSVASVPMLARCHYRADRR